MDCAIGALLGPVVFLISHIIILVARVPHFFLSAYILVFVFALFVGRRYPWLAIGGVAGAVIFGILLNWAASKVTVWP